MGLNWREVDLAEYLEALEAHNEAQSPDAGAKVDPSDSDKSRLALLVAAHNGGHAGVSRSIGETLN